MECPYTASDFLLGSAGVTAAVQGSFFIVAANFQFDKVTDFAGGGNFVLLAVLGLVLQHSYSPRQVIFTACVVAWGVRLSGYLLMRVLKTGKDDRFDTWNRGFTLEFAGFWVAQAVWVWVVSLPVTLINATCDNDMPMSALDYIGILLFAAGFLIESVADHQKFTFKNDESSKGMFMSTGLWSWSRHPNYFGEMLVWWGLFIASASVLSHGWSGWMLVVSLASPLTLTLLLLFASGMPILEASADKRYGDSDEYKRYKSETSILVPLPPSLYATLPAWLKTSILLDLPIYNNSGGGASSASGGSGRLP